jgi:Tfp pilus assembly protein PilN
VSQQINLYRKTRSARLPGMLSGAGVMLASAAMFALLVPLSVVVTARSVWLQSDFRELDAEGNRIGQSLEELGRRALVRPTDTAMAAELATLESLTAAPDSVYAALERDSFNDIKGYSDILVALARQDLPQLWLTGIQIEGAGNDLVLRGRAFDAARVPQYLQRLSAEPVLKGMRFETFGVARPGKAPAGDESANEASMLASTLESLTPAAHAAAPGQTAEKYVLFEIRSRAKPATEPGQ